MKLVFVCMFVCLFIFGGEESEGDEYEPDYGLNYRVSLWAAVEPSQVFINARIFVRFDILCCLARWKCSCMKLDLV